MALRQRRSVSHLRRRGLSQGSDGLSEEEEHHRTGLATKSRARLARRAKRRVDCARVTMRLAETLDGDTVFLDHALLAATARLEALDMTARLGLST